MPSYSSEPGYHRDAGVIGDILKNDPGGRAAVDAGAASVLAAIPAGERGEAFLGKPYVTDRYVHPVKVPKDSQAKHGTATRAAQQVAQTHAKPRHRATD